MPDIICDRCGFRKDLLSAIGDEAARAAIAAALKLPAPLADAALRYMALFETAGRGLTWPRYAKALESLVLLIAADTVTWKGNRRAVSLALWTECLRELVESTTLELPLKSHGYLTAMAYRKADAAEAKAEAVRIEASRNRGAVGAVSQPRPAAGPTEAQGDRGGDTPPATGRTRPVGDLLSGLAPGLRRPRDGE